MKDYRNIALAIVKTMPKEKVFQLKKQLERNCFLSSFYGFESAEITEYEEGFYIVFSGTRSGFKVFYSKSQRRVIRKPADSKLNKIITKWVRFDCLDFQFFSEIKVPA